MVVVIIVMADLRDTIRVALGIMDGAPVTMDVALGDIPVTLADTVAMLATMLVGLGTTTVGRATMLDVRVITDAVDVTISLAIITD